MIYSWPIWTLLLREEKLQDIRIRFPETELTLFLDQSAEVNIDAISIAKAGLGLQDKLNLVYEKPFLLLLLEIGFILNNGNPL